MNAERLLQLYDRVSEAPDAIPRLRRFILDLAMRGKLVQQYPSDEPALKDVFQARMASNDTPRKKKTKRGEVPTRSSNTPPFLLPKQWAWTTFGRLHDLIRGVTYSKSDVGEGAGNRYIPVLRANNIGVTLNSDNPVYVRRERISQAQLLRRGDFMIALSSGSKNLVGKAAHVPEDLKAAFGGFCGVIRLHDHRLEDFVRIYLKSDLYRKSISEGSRGIGINNLKKDVLASTAFPLPPLAEQRRIVAKVDELMALCDSLAAEREKREATRARLTTASLRRLTAPDVDEEQFKAHADFAIKVLPELTTRPDQIKVLRQTIMDLAVRGKLVEQDPNDEPATELLKRIEAQKANLKRQTGDSRVRLAPRASVADYPSALPHGWEVESFENLFLFIDYRGRTPPKTADGIPLLTAKNVRMGVLNREPREFIAAATYRGWMVRGFPKLGDLLFTTEAPLANVCLNNVEESFALAQRVICLQPYGEINTKFIMFALMSDVIQDLIQEHATGMTAKGIKAAKLKPLPLPIPPLAEQHRIVARVDELMSVCDHLEKRLESGLGTRRRLLQAVLVGAMEPQIIEAA